MRLQAAGAPRARGDAVEGGDGGCGERSVEEAECLHLAREGALGVARAPANAQRVAQ